MRAGFIVPTNLEATNFREDNEYISSIGYGAGKTAACSAAANLIFNKKCDTIIIWGLAGGLSNRINVNDIVIGSSVAYRDYNIAPLMNSTGVGFVPEFAENDSWVKLDNQLGQLLYNATKAIFPAHRIISDGKVCTGDQFIQHTSRNTYNEIERDADIVDMESAAVVHFCHNLNKFTDTNIKVGIVRVISDNADHSADVNFSEFLNSFAKMNKEIMKLRNYLDSKNQDMSKILNAIKDYQDFPVKGVLFKDIWGVIFNHELVDEVCHKLYSAFNEKFQSPKITKIAGIESRGFIFGYELAKIFNVPFVPIRKAGKLPGTVITKEYKTEYSSTKLEIRSDFFNSEDNVLLFDDILATGGSLIAARNAIVQTGAICNHALIFGKIKCLNGDIALKEERLSYINLIDL